MSTRTINILVGILFSLSGCFTLLDGIYNTRASNLFIGVCFVVVGCMYFVRKRERQ